MHTACEAADRFLLRGLLSAQAEEAWERVGEEAEQVLRCHVPCMARQGGGTPSAGYEAVCDRGRGGGGALW